MKNTLTLIGAIAVAIGVIAAAAILVKKYGDKLCTKKKEKCNCGYCEENDYMDFDEDIDWEEVPVEDDLNPEDILSESIDELDNLDGKADTDNI